MGILNATQRTALRTFLLGTTDPALQASVAARNDTETARLLNLDASPDFWVWRTSVTEANFTNDTSVDGTNWSWPAYIARVPGEQNGWDRLWRGGTVNMDKANVRQAFQDIFSGGANSAPQQRAHCIAIARRKATVAERIFTTGTGSTASPGSLVVEGSVDIDDVGRALNGQ